MLVNSVALMGWSVFVMLVALAGSIIVGMIIAKVKERRYLKLLTEEVEKK